MSIRSVVSSAFEAASYVPLDSAEVPALSGGRLVVPPALLRDLSRAAFSDAAFYLRRTHLAALAAVLEDPGASDNDRFVVRTLLRNALVAARGELAFCQDTGTATVAAWKDESVHTGADDEAELAEGARRAYRERFLRDSQVAPRSFFDEADTGDNLPAQVHLEATPDGKGGPAYRFLFIAKGGGSANKTSFFQMSKALLEAERFDAFLAEKVAALGTAACPPYRLAVVVGGTSPEENLRILKLATTELLDGAEPFGASPPERGRIAGAGDLRRDSFWERRLMDHARESGLGAQFGGSALALDARVLRLPRHAASCPVSIGVSCAAHRNVLAVVDAAGARIEALEKDPARFLSDLGGAAAGLVAETEGRAPGRKAAARSAAPERAEETEIDLDRPMEEIRAALSARAVGDRVLLSGRIVVARDAAHLRWHALAAAGKSLPDYVFRHPIMYAGPAATPPGKSIGAFGPTTAQRMDAYAEELLSRGASLVSIAKGNRGPAWTAACRAYGGFYLGVIGGAAALIAEEHIGESQIIDYPELGMEAVRLIRVSRLPAFVIVDDKGNELYARLRGGRAATGPKG